MNSKILNEEELAALKTFIKSKRYKEPILVQEILDHFACKVEELMTRYPKFSLEEAMEKAYRSFGVSGFRPLVEAFEHELRHKYKRVFKNKLKSTLVHPLFVILIIILTVAFFRFRVPIQGYLELTKDTWDWYFKLSVILLPQLFLLFYEYPKKNIYFHRVIHLYGDFIEFYFPIFIVFTSPEKLHNAYFFGVFLLFFIAEIVIVYCRIDSLKKAEEDYTQLLANSQ